MLWGLEPSIGMREKDDTSFKKSPITVQWLRVPGEKYLFMIIQLIQ
jgi:hypothetical protein